MVLLSRESLSIAIAAAGMLAQTSFGSGEFQYGTITETGEVCATALAQSPNPGIFDKENLCVSMSDGFGFAAANAALDYISVPCTFKMRSTATLTTAYVLTTDPGQLGIGGESLAVHTVRARGQDGTCQSPDICTMAYATADAESDLLIDVNFTLDEDRQIRVSICALSRNIREGSSTFEWHLFDDLGNDLYWCFLSVSGDDEDSVTPYSFNLPKGDYLWQVIYSTQGLSKTASVVGCPKSASDSLIGGDAWAATLNIVKVGGGP